MAYSYSCSCLFNNVNLNVRFLIMAKQIENIRQDIISDTSYYSNMYATLDFIIDAIDKNNLKDAKTLVNEVQNDLQSLANDNGKIQLKLVDLIKKYNHGK